mgnify:CR=1 FL=1|jgi:uncharacterized sodium:solute symporter family permease YidK|tara:strand:- start:181 stop:432 length:252 start_codon:yes stop_codon:yes gene_type:complete
MFYECIIILVYSVYFKNRFLKHYFKHISDAYRKRFEKESSIIFEVAFIASNAIIAEAKSTIQYLKKLLKFPYFFLSKWKIEEA